MYSTFKSTQKYLQYWVTANNGKGHGIHSPFVYDFIRNVLINKKKYPAYKQIAQLCKRLKKDHRIVDIEDFCERVTIPISQKVKMANLYRSMIKPAKYGQLFFRMARHYKSQYVLEIGSSLGITTSYLALANADTTIITYEESDAIAKIAAQNFSSLSIKNTIQILGNVNNTLKDTLNKIIQLDFVFVNGNNCKETILFYWNILYNKAHNETLFIFDKIHGSAEMEEIWKKIQQLDMVTCTIDLFFIGIVSIRKEIKGPVHLSVRY